MSPGTVGRRDPENGWSRHMAIFRKKTSSWDREPDDLGRRIESKDVKNAGLNRPFVVQTGVSALVFTEGLLKGRLEPGKYDVDGILKRFIVGDSSTTFVLVDDGQTPLEFFVDNLHSEEGIGVWERASVWLLLHIWHGTSVGLVTAGIRPFKHRRRIGLKHDERRVHTQRRVDRGRDRP